MTKIAVVFAAFLYIGCSGAKPQYQTVTGVYRGTLPCADCPGIHLTVRLSPDKTAERTMEYIDHTDRSNWMDGWWELNADGLITVYPREGEITYYRAMKNAIQMLDRNGKEIKTKEPEKYILPLYANDSMLVLDYWQNQFLRGTAFSARGSDPAWALDIDPYEMTVFRTQGKPYYFGPPAESYTDKNGQTYYKSVNENDSVIFKLIKSDCSDDITGQKYRYNVTVTKGDHTYTGCGKYLYDSRLTGTWRAVWMFDATGGKDLLPNGSPKITIDGDAGTVSGFTGCNNFKGSIELQGVDIRFLPLASTKMSCEFMEIEQTFLKQIASVKRYIFREKELQFVDQDNAVLIRFIK
jgi:heat shock protein HslJ